MSSSPKHYRLRVGVRLVFNKYLEEELYDFIKFKRDKTTESQLEFDQGLIIECVLYLFLSIFGATYIQGCKGKYGDPVVDASIVNAA